MEKERFLVEVTVKGEKGWKAIHMCGSMADAVPVAGCGTQPLLSARHAHRYPRAGEEGQGFGGLTGGKERRLHGKAF